MCPLLILDSIHGSSQSEYVLFSSMVTDCNVVAKVYHSSLDLYHSLFPLHGAV